MNELEQLGNSFEGIGLVYQLKKYVCKFLSYVKPVKRSWLKLGRSRFEMTAET